MPWKQNNLKMIYVFVDALVANQWSFCQRWIKLGMCVMIWRTRTFKSCRSFDLDLTFEKFEEKSPKDLDWDIKLGKGCQFENSREKMTTMFASSLLQAVSWLRQHWKPGTLQCTAAAAQVSHSKTFGNHINDFQPLDFKHDFKGNQAVKHCMQAFSGY